ncbi:MAG: hypothetical protein ACLUFI_11170 [Oscillospiraceae bacterium]
MKEQTEKIFRAISDVGDDLIERADRPVRKHAQVWVKWAALAACCALVIGAAAFIVPMFHAGSSAPETASLSVDAAPAETELAAQEMETAEAAPERGYGGTRSRGGAGGQRKERPDASGRRLLRGRAGEHHTRVGGLPADVRRRRPAGAAQ